MQSGVMIAMQGLTDSFLLLWLGVMISIIPVAVVMHKINGKLIRGLKI